MNEEDLRAFQKRHFGADDAGREHPSAVRSLKYIRNGIQCKQRRSSLAFSRPAGKSCYSAVAGGETFQSASDQSRIKAGLFTGIFASVGLPQPSFRKELVEISSMFRKYPLPPLSGAARWNSSRAVNRRPPRGRRARRRRRDWRLSRQRRRGRRVRV